jgi:hypothetical protein
LYRDLDVEEPEAVFGLAADHSGAERHGEIS